MAIDRLTIASAIKILTSAVYLIYFIISNANPSIIFKIGFKPEIELKKELLSNKCLLLLGGSNVRMGLSAEKISIKSCPALNFGVSLEAGGFQQYLNLFNQNIFAEKIIYSPAAFWWTELPLINNNNEEAKFKFPILSIFSILKYLLLSQNKDFLIFNKFGDQIEYTCLKKFPSYNIEINKYTKSDFLISQEIYKRVSTLSKVTNSNEIFVRVPPIYVKTNEQAEIYTNLINKRIEMLKGLGIKIVGSTIVSTDESLFCDSFHPNAKGREEFTKEIGLP